MKTTKMEWADKIPEVKELVKTKTKQELADHFGVDRKAIDNMLKRYGLKGQPGFAAKLKAISTEEFRAMRHTKTV